MASILPDRAPGCDPLCTEGSKTSCFLHRLWLTYDEAKQVRLAHCCKEIWKGVEQGLKPEQYLKPWLPESDIMFWEMGLSQGRPLLAFPIIWIRLEQSQSWVNKFWRWCVHAPLYSEKDTKVLREIHRFFKAPYQEGLFLLGDPQAQWKVSKYGDFERDVQAWKILSLKELREDWAIELADYVGMGLIREVFVYLCEREGIHL